MFERYTDRARRVLFFARYEAGQLGSRSVEPEHLLLGLVRESSGVAGRIFASVRIALEDIREEIEDQIGRNERVADMAELPIGPGAQQALESAATEADRFGDRDVNAEHLLLGILQDEDSVAASVLNARGLQLDAVRAQIFELRREHSTESPAPSVLYSDPSTKSGSRRHGEPRARGRPGAATDGAGLPRARA